MNFTDKEKIVVDVLAIFRSNEKIKGYSYLCRIIARVWQDENTDWTTYDRYIIKIANEETLPESKIISLINSSITNIWNQYNGINRKLLRFYFNYNHAPTITEFIRMMLSLLLFCEKNKIDIITLLLKFRDSENFENDIDININNIIAGQVIIILKELKLDDTIINKTIPIIENNLKNNNDAEALFTYIKSTSDLFAVISFDDIVIPPELYNMYIATLDYDDDILGIRIENALLRNGVTYLKDLRYKSVEDVKKFKNLGDKSYNQFLSDLKRTIEQEKENKSDDSKFKRYFNRSDFT